MLILLKGKARKSEYFAMLHNGHPDSELIQYGQSVNTLGGIVLPRKDITKTDMNELGNDLSEILADFLNTDVRALFLYCNFTVEEVKVLERLIEGNGNLLDIFVSVQDRTVPDGQLVIEEIRL